MKCNKTMYTCIHSTSCAQTDTETYIQHDIQLCDILSTSYSNVIVPLILRTLQRFLYCCAHILDMTEVPLLLRSHSGHDRGSSIVALTFWTLQRFLYCCAHILDITEVPLLLRSHSGHYRGSSIVVSLQRVDSSLD